MIPVWFRQVLIEALVLVLKEIFTHHEELPTPPTSL